MPTTRPPASNRIRTLIAASCVISGLAFMLGQGVAAYQAKIFQPRLASMVSQVNEQVSIAHGETPTPTVHAAKVTATVHAAKRKSAASTTHTAALMIDTQTPSPTADAKDKHGQDNQDKQDNQGKHDGNAGAADSSKDSGQSNKDGNANSPKDIGQSDKAEKPDATGNSDTTGQPNAIGTTGNNTAANP